MERDEWQRATWRETVAEEIDARRLVFVDEMGTNTSLSPLYGVAAPLQPDFGERVSPGCPKDPPPTVLERPPSLWKRLARKG